MCINRSAVEVNPTDEPYNIVLKKLSILAAREKIFHIGKRVVFSHDLIVYMNFEMPQRSVWHLPPQYWRGINDASSFV